MLPQYQRLPRRLFTLFALQAIGCTWAESLRIGLVTDAKQPEFVAAMRTGAEQAGVEWAKSGARIELVSRQPAKTGDRNEQARLVDALVREHVDGLLVDSIDRQVMQPEIDRAAQAHIPIVLIDAPADTEAAVQVVATDNREAGRQAARHLGRLLDGRGGVLLLRYQIYATKTEQREEGFIEVVTREFPGLTLVASDYHAGPTVESARRVAASLLHRYGPAIQGVFSSSESGTLGMLDALRAAGRASGQVKVIGSDEGGRGLALALRGGDLQGFVSEDPVAMGFAGLQAVVRARRNEAIAPAVVTKLSWVDANGVMVIPPAVGADSAAELRGRVPGPLCPPIPRVRFAPIGGLPQGNFSVPELGLAMIALAPGSFRRPAEGAQDGNRVGNTPRAVTITISRPFWLGACDVTQSEWKQLMPSNPSDFHGDCLPVENIGWNDACEFCRRLTARERAAGRLPEGYAYMLPTEAQWEYAAGAGASVRTTAELLEQAWCATNSGSDGSPGGIWRMSTHPVGEKRANACGFYDLLGNVAQWCADWSEAYPAGNATDPRGPDHGTYRALRGGCWWADVQNCQPESRHKAPPGRHHSGLGMRVALCPVSP